MLIGRYWWQVANPIQINEADTKRLDKFIAYIDSIEAQAMPPIVRIDTAQKQDWIELGLEEWQIDILENYRSKGGQFIQGSDLLKVYGIDSSWYEAVKDYLLPGVLSDNAVLEENKFELKEETSNNTFSYKSIEEKYDRTFDHEKELLLKFEVNNAKPEDFEKVYGIGAKRASIIINYRNALGGFHSLSQIDELYAFPDEVKATLKEHIEIDTSLIKKLSLSKSAFKDFLRHPYLDYFYTKTIFEAASSKDFEIDDLRKLPEISDSLFFKIRPYLAK